MKKLGLHVGIAIGTLVMVDTAGCSTVGCPAGQVEKDGDCQTLQDLGLAAGGASGDGSSSSRDASSVSAGTEARAGVSAGNTASGQSAMTMQRAARGTPGAGAPGGAPELCTGEGLERCSPYGAGNREVCTAGVWMPSSPCPATQSCSTDGSGAPSCLPLAELCRGNGGQTVCDALGSLIVCNLDEAIALQMSCLSARHCQAGVAAQACALCLPVEEYRCTDRALEQCADDGMSFLPLTECEAAGLCNPLLGMCTTAVCMPATVTCDKDNLITCNLDGTAIDAVTACSPGMCDGAGADCNTCMPGMKKCEGDLVATCDTGGQAFMAAPCLDGLKCVGMGQCVDCAADDDCNALDEGCQIGICSRNTCLANNAPETTACTASNGEPGACLNGSCECTPQCRNKPCGGDGCGGTCPDNCGGRYCDVDRCVECLSDSQCDSGSTDCREGVCNSSGSCELQNVPNGTSCGSSGTCRGGSCMTPSNGGSGGGGGRSGGGGGGGRSGGGGGGGRSGGGGAGGAPIQAPSKREEEAARTYKAHAAHKYLW